MSAFINYWMYEIVNINKCNIISVTYHVMIKAREQQSEIIQDRNERWNASVCILRSFLLCIWYANVYLTTEFSLLLVL